MAFLESYTMVVGKDRGLVDSFVKSVESELGSDEASKRLKSYQQRLDDVETKKRKLVNLLLEEQLDKKLFEGSMYELDEKMKALEENIDQLNLQLEHENELSKRIDSFKKVLYGDVKFESFDRHIFESLIEKVIVGSIDEDGNADPYNLTFIYKTGLDNNIDSEKYRKDGRKKKIHCIAVK